MSENIPTFTEIEDQKFRLQCIKEARKFLKHRAGITSSADLLNVAELIYQFTKQ